MKVGRLSGFAAVATGLTLVASAAFAADNTTYIGADYSFSQNMGTGPTGSYATVKTLVQLSDGDFLVGGNFKVYDGAPSGGLVRLNPDGSTDTAFQTAIGTGPGTDPGNNGNVWTAMQQTDGKIIVGGGMQSFNGVPVGNLVRLNPDGSIDTAFQTAIGTAAGQSIITDVIQLSDGDLLVTGYFDSFNGKAAGHLVRLNPDGSVDTAFQTAISTGSDGLLYDAIELSNGDILVGGHITRFAGKSFGTNLVRLHADGSIDTAFQTALKGGSNGAVCELAELSDGRILAGCNFPSFAQQPAGGLVALNPNGTLDTAFNAAIGTGAENGNVWEIAELSDGDIMISGVMRKFNGNDVGGMVRLHPDGTVNSDFSASVGTGANDMIYMFLELPSNHFLIGGAFTTFSSDPAVGVARIGAESAQIDTIGDQIATVGDGFEVSAVATISDGSPAIYYADGLPDGVEMDSNTGVMSGVPTVAGDYTVTIQASSLTWINLANLRHVVDTTFTLSVAEAGSGNPAVVDPTDPAVNPTNPAVDPTNPAVNPIVDPAAPTGSGTTSTGSATTSTAGANGANSGSGLAMTGAGVAGLVAVSLALLAGGIAVLRTRRRNAL